MRVQALYADARSPDAAARLGEIGAHGRCSSPLRVLFVGSRERFWTHQLFESVHTTFAFESTHRVVKIRIDEPVQRRHWGAVAQVRLILDDNGASVLPAHHDREPPAEGSTYQRFDNLLVVGGRVTKGQRQNSSVRTRRDTNPAR